jgi:DNA-binding MarR family transcriptional regulator
MGRSRSSRNEVTPREYDELAREAVRREDPDADLEAMAFGFGLIRVANRFQQDVEAHVMRPLGLSYAAFRVMFCIRTVGPVPPKEIARHSGVSQPTITSVVNTLARRDLVTRSPSADDGRGVIVGLTRTGDKVVSEMLRGVNDRESRWISSLSEAERDGLVATLQRLMHQRV